MEPSPQEASGLTEHAGPVTKHPSLLGAVGGGWLLQGLVKLAVGGQQGWNPLDLHGADTWGRAEASVTKAQCPRYRGPRPQPTAPLRAGKAGHRHSTFHVHLGGLHDFLVDHELWELSEKDGAGVDEDGVIQERGLQRGMTAFKEWRPKRQ